MRLMAQVIGLPFAYCWFTESFGVSDPENVQGPVDQPGAIA